VHPGASPAGIDFVACSALPRERRSPYAQERRSNVAAPPAHGGAPSVL